MISDRASLLSNHLPSSDRDPSHCDYLPNLPERSVPAPCLSEQSVRSETSHPTTNMTELQPSLPLATIITSVNATTPYWRLGPLPGEWLFYNGSSQQYSNNGSSYWYYYQANNSAEPLVWIKINNITHIGSLQLNSFVYLIISFVVFVLLLLLPNCRYITRLLLGNDRRFGTSTASNSDYAFDRELKNLYPTEGPEPLPSYPEVLHYHDSKAVRAQDIRECQSMIRKIYALKVDAYNARDVRRANMEIVAEWKMQASAGLRDVKSLVEKWDQRRDWDDYERVKVTAIRQRILAIQPDA